MINLGDKVKDKVSGIGGTVVAKCEYLNGCIQYGVTPKGKSTATEISTIYIDEQQLDVIKQKSINVKSTPTGGASRTVINKSRNI